MGEDEAYKGTAFVANAPNTTCACPRCGYCPHCGRGGYVYPLPYYPCPGYPSWPYVPSPWWGTVTVTNGAATTGNTTSFDGTNITFTGGGK